MPPEFVEALGEPRDEVDDLRVFDGWRGLGCGGLAHDGILESASDLDESKLLATGPRGFAGHRIVAREAGVAEVLT